MNREYPKIKNIFRFSANYTGVCGLNYPFESLQNIEYVCTEKVDGTNIRIIWDGHKVSFAGHTEKSEIPQHLIQFLESKFLTQEMEYLFEQVFNDKEVIIYGEGYGNKIQANGDKYLENEVDFIAFDVLVNNKFVNRNNVNDICYKLGINSVPIVFWGTLLEVIEYVSRHNASKLNEEHEMEGVVARPEVEIYDEKGFPITCKIKYQDIKKWEETIKEQGYL